MGLDARDERPPVRYAGGVKLTGRALWFDPVERKPLAILTNGLVPPLIAHERAVLHPALLDLHPRRRSRQAFLTADYGQKVLLGSFDLSLHPAGVHPGSSQVLVEGDAGTLLYVSIWNPRATRVAENYLPVRADVLALDLDGVDLEPHGGSRDAAVARVLGRLREIVAAGSLPLLFVPGLGIPQEIALGRGPQDPPWLVHHAVLPGLLALGRGGATLAEGIAALRRSVFRPGHVVVLPESMRGLFPREEGRVLLGFGAGDDLDERFPRFSHPDLADARALVEASGARELVLLARDVSAWLPRLALPADIRVHALDKEAQVSLL